MWHNLPSGGPPRGSGSGWPTARPRTAHGALGHEEAGPGARGEGRRTRLWEVPPPGGCASGRGSCVRRGPRAPRTEFLGLPVLFPWPGGLKRRGTAMFCAVFRHPAYAVGPVQPPDRTRPSHHGPPLAPRHRLEAAGHAPREPGPHATAGQRPHTHARTVASHPREDGDFPSPRDESLTPTRGQGPHATAGSGPHAAASNPVSRASFFSSSSACFSIWRMRSRVRPCCLPTSVSVRSRPSSMP